MPFLIYRCDFSEGSVSSEEGSHRYSTTIAPFAENEILEMSEEFHSGMKVISYLTEIVTFSSLL
jgi:hypothetical protein